MRKIISIQVVLLAIAVNTFSQNVGIGTLTPSEKLHVAGNIKADTVKPNAVRLTPNAGAGKLLTSDAVGNANWQERSAGLGVGFGSWGDCNMNGVVEYNPVADASGAVNDNFGTSVSISGNYAIVGAYLDDGPNANQGSASIYQYDGHSWVLMQKIIDVTGGAGDLFGRSVSISGNYAIVGAYGDDVSGNLDQGSVSIYQYNGSSWELMQKITDATGAAGDNFGNSVSISGNYAIVGAYFDDVSAADQGSVSIYQYNGITWELMQKITDPGGALSDLFGYSVSINGNNVIIGVYGDDVSGQVDQGSARIYQYNGTSWVFIQQLTDAAGVATDLFGYSVSIWGNYAIVGAIQDDVLVSNQGSANIYQYNGVNWVFMQQLTDATGATGDRFGGSVSLSGNYVIVGASNDDIGSTLDQGSVNIYLRVGLKWQKLQFITDPGGNQSDLFGISSAIDGSTQRFLIGAYGYATNSGKAVFGKVN